MREVIAVDVGVDAAGIASWQLLTKMRKPKAPTHALSAPVPPSIIAATVLDELWLRRVAWLAGILDEWISPETSVVALELPRHFGSVVGMAAAGRGDVVKLATCVGMMAQVAASHGIEATLVPVNAWKGNLKKPVVERRLARAIGNVDGNGSSIREHAWDAVGIGLYAMGFHINDSRWFA